GVCCVRFCVRQCVCPPFPSIGCAIAGGSEAAIVPFIGATLCLIFGSPMSSKAKVAAPELNFEKAMDRLEAIVEQMETGKLPLEDLIVRYEEGMNLVKVCQERLTNAEQKIEIIARNNAGKPVVKNFEAA